MNNLREGGPLKDSKTTDAGFFVRFTQEMNLKAAVNWDWAKL
jgi:hypothetical protein